MPQTHPVHRRPRTVLKGPWPSIRTRKGSDPIRLARRPDASAPGFGGALARAAWTSFATVPAADVWGRNPSTRRGAPADRAGLTGDPGQMLSLEFFFSMRDRWTAPSTDSHPPPPTPRNVNPTAVRSTSNSPWKPIRPSWNGLTAPHWMNTS